MSGWEGVGSAVAGGVRRDLFYIGGKERVYASLYAAHSDAGAPAFVLCPSWGHELSDTLELCSALARGLARSGGAGLVLHWPGHGESEGRPEEAGIEQMAAAAERAIREARRRVPSVPWGLAGVRVGAAAAAMAARSEGAAALLLIRPVLDPARYFSELERSGRRASLGRYGGAPWAFGHPLPRDRSRVDVSGALAAFANPAASVEFESDPPEPSADGLPTVRVHGSWKPANRARFAKLVQASLEWAASLEGLAPIPTAAAAPATGKPTIERLPTDHPVLVPTSAGLLGGVVSVPATDPSTAVALFPGWGGARAGTNRLWPTVARAIAAQGGVVMRLDYPDWGDSDPHPDPDVVTGLAIRESIEWFRERTGGLDLMLIGSCYGARLALRVAVEDPSVKGLALLDPYVRTEPSTSPLFRAARSVLWPPVRTILRVVAPPKVGEGDLGGGSFRPRDRSVEQWLKSLSRRIPVWVLAGEYDFGARWLLGMQEARSGGGLTVEVIPGTALHTYGPPRAQEETLTRILAWAGRAVAGKVEA